jgi:hypothetical protein
MLLCAGFSQRALAQYFHNCPYTPYRWSLHISNPLGMGSKIGGRLQYRFGTANSVLLGYRQYYGVFPGTQISGEYHRTFSIQDGENEAFFYGKAGLGNANYQTTWYYNGEGEMGAEPGRYIFAGGGVGKRINIGHFFIEGHIGVKLSQPFEKVNGIDEKIFYTLGPASFLDCGVHFGFQFFDEERSLHRKGMSPHKPWKY